MASTASASASAGTAWRIDLGMFRHRAFTVPLASNALCFFVLYGTSFFLVQYMQLYGRTRSGR